MAVLTLLEAKEHLNITNTANDTEIESLIAAAQAAITELVGPLEPTTVTRRLNGGSVILLPVWPVISLTSISDSAGNAQTVGDYYLDTNAGILSVSAGGYFGSRFYTVTYLAGRTVCPPDLLLAVKELVRHLWGSQRSPALYPGSTLTEGPPATGAYLMPFRVRELLEPHMQHGFA